MKESKRDFRKEILLPESKESSRNYSSQMKRDKLLSRRLLLTSLARQKNMWLSSRRTMAVRKGI